MNEFKVYEHKAHYYETDQMGIVHHSNYIRWFEEARVDLMSQAGMPYKKLEEAGIISAVIEASLQYRSMVRFEEVVTVFAQISRYNGATMTVQYEIRDKESGQVRCTGETKHCFLGTDNKLISLKKTNPLFHNLFKDLIFEEKVL